MSCELNNEPGLDFEAWRTLLRSHCGQYSPQRGDRNAFAGAVRPKSVSGLKAVNISCNIHRVDRTLSDTRRDEVDRYTLFFVTSGRATVIQHDRATELSVGDCALVDVARPVSFITGNAYGEFLALQLPRQPLISHLGLEPMGGLCWRGNTLAANLLTRLVLDNSIEGDDPCAPAEYYMQLAICDLLGALLSSSDLPSYFSHNEKIFARVCNVAKSHFSNPDIRPRDVAIEAGISLRYLQKLFTAHGTTCSRYIQSLRLDHAARLLRLRNLSKSGQPLSEIAYASGFQNYARFTRIFRRRFGRPPSAEAAHCRNIATE